MSTVTRQRRRLIITGQIQGVGFRPYVYRLALEHALYGFVKNTADGVQIEVQGTQDAIDRFCAALPLRLPPLAQITSCTITEIPPVTAAAAFYILTSEHEGGGNVLISPDVSICEACTADIRNPQNRRYHYPFTNCTNCGPRYTITHAIPYDRATTSMACFPQCPSCQSEYTDPHNRRFHAQPNACPQCGPHVWIAYPHSTQATLSPGATTKAAVAQPAAEAPFIAIAQALLAGKIAAIKGLGGFHLACNALDAAAVALLRHRKKRPHKPLAIMPRDMETAKRIAKITPEAEHLLYTPAHPIALCPRTDILPDILAPDTDDIGIVLPYTPLHMVLLDICAAHFPAAMPIALVMTSGNNSGEPICLSNREALRQLSHIADIFLLHNRDILVRNDDSVVGLLPQWHTTNTGTRAASDHIATATAMTATPAATIAIPDTQSSNVPDCTAATPQPHSADEQQHTDIPRYIFYRRARGYVPQPITLPASGVCVLGTGAELKNTLCLTRGNAAFVSQYIGDMQNMATIRFHEQVAEHLETLLEVTPQAVICDRHPDFAASLFAQELAQKRNIPLLQLQHHFAHGWSALTEHQRIEPTLILALDGTGLGDDGTIWGGELLWIDPQHNEHRRCGRLKPFLLAGGDAAIQEPWRIALALCKASQVPPPQWQHIPQQQHDAVALMLQKNIRCIQTSSAGRLFDAVSALLGLCHTTSYEGQAAIRLEACTHGSCPKSVKGYPVSIQQHDELWEIDTYALFHSLAQDWNNQSQHDHTAQAHIARRFHVSIAQGFAEMARIVAKQTQTYTIALTGGVLQNMVMVPLLCRALSQCGLTPLLHKKLPPNDGSISLGQAAYGHSYLRHTG